MAGGVYRITNKVSKRTYIGSSMNLDVRRETHFNALRLKRHHSHKLQSDYNNHGAANFEFAVLREWGGDESTMEILERVYIVIYNAIDHGYNVRSDVFRSESNFIYKIRATYWDSYVKNQTYYPVLSPQEIGRRAIIGQLIEIAFVLLKIAVWIGAMAILFSGHVFLGAVAVYGAYLLSKGLKAKDFMGPGMQAKRKIWDLENKKLSRAISLKQAVSDIQALGYERKLSEIVAEWYVRDMEKNYSPRSLKRQKENLSFRYTPTKDKKRDAA